MQKALRVSLPVLLSVLAFGASAPLAFAAAPGAVIINEFVANPSTGNEWVELYNTSGSSIDVTGWKLEDGAATPHMLSLSGTIAANGFSAFDFSGSILNNDGDTISLHDDTSATIDAIAYGSDPSPVIAAPASGESAYRTTDGGGTWAISATPTKGTTNTPAAPCSTGIGSPLLVDVTQHITNDPDSGNFGGNWALDDFYRHIQIWQEGTHYCAQADDSGTFTTFGGADGKSPESGAALPEIVTGSMTGGTHGELTGTLSDTGNWGVTPPAVDCNADAALCASGLTSLWVQNYFPGGAYAYDNGWSWTYDGGANGSWTNSTVSTGDIVHIIPSVVYVSTTGNDSNDGSMARPFATIQAAMNAVADNGIVKINPGEYNLTKDDSTSISGQTGWYLPIIKDGLTLEGVTADGQEITDASNVAAYLYSTQETANGAWATQNLITVFADDVTIRGLGIMNKLSPNKGIEVLGNNFKAQYDEFAPIPVSILPSVADYSDPDGSTHNDISAYGSGVYFNNNDATAVRTGVVSDNIFKHSGVTFDSFRNNWTVTVRNNVFDGNKAWGTDYYSAIGATTWANQPDFTDSTITINGNQFINMTSDHPLLKIKTGMTGVFNAIGNWWGSATGPDSGTIVANGGTIITTPWLMDTTSATLGFGTPTVAGQEASTTLVSAVTQTGSDDGVTITAEIPANTVITGNASWDGTISAPIATTVSVSSESGYSTEVTSAIAVGSSDSDLTFDQAVKLTFTGQAGKRVGWYDHAGVFTEITGVCSANDQTSGNTLASGSSCKIDASSDLVVWTKHFSTFATYTTVLAAPVINPNTTSFIGTINVTMDDSATGSSVRYTTDGTDPTCGSGSGYTNGQVLTFSVTTTLKARRCDSGGDASASAVSSAIFTKVASGGGGAGGSSGSIAATPATPATPTVAPATPATPAKPALGKVLGAEAYNFAKDLHIGSTGADVTELQKALIAGGFDIPAITKGGMMYGTFGGQTLSAVIAYQKAHDIAPAKGYVSTLTRAVLNKGTVATTTETSSVAAGKTSLTASQADSILSLLESFGAEASVVAKVRVTLGR